MTVSDLVTQYDQSGYTTTTGELFNEIHRKLLFYDKSYFHQYLPALDSDEYDFQTRLQDWLNNPCVDDEKRAMLEAAADITFFSREDILKLHQAALNGPISRWIVDQLPNSLEDPTLESVLSAEINKHTWFCAVTDSMRISDFHHANRIGGINLRPEAKSLARFADRNRVLDFLRTRTSASGTPQPIKRIVLLEDFIGSGTQIRETERTELSATGNRTYDAISFMASLDSGIQVLLCPLIVCPPGDTYAKSLLALWPNLKYEPVLRLSEDEFVNDATVISPGTINEKIKQLAISTYPSVLGDGSKLPLPYGQFGAFNVGARVVMYSNTPANTLPFIQHRSNLWKPLFPRSARIK